MSMFYFAIGNFHSYFYCMEQHESRDLHPDEVRKTTEVMDPGSSRRAGKNTEWTGVGEAFEHTGKFEQHEAVPVEGAPNEYWKMKIASALQSLLNDEEQARQKITERYPNPNKDQN